MNIYPGRKTLSRTKKCASRNAVTRVYDAAGNVIETHEHAGEFKTISGIVFAHFR